MAKEWNYAELSKLAKEAGGPEKFVDMLEATSRKAGKMEMMPWIGVAAIVSSFFTVGVIEVVNYFKKQKNKDEKNIKALKKELVEGINEYDATHNLQEDKNFNDGCSEQAQDEYGSIYI